MDDGQEDAIPLEQLEVVVGGLTRPWAGFWQPADLEPRGSAPEAPTPPPTSGGEH
jgi:hypothetical protein